MFERLYGVSFGFEALLGLFKSKGLKLLEDYKRLSK